MGQTKLFTKKKKKKKKKKNMNENILETDF